MRKHLVIIEDDEQLRATLDIILVDAGYKVTSMAAVDTVEELIDLQADCFIIDEHLPVITGHIICIILGIKTETKHIPVILTSAMDDLEHYASLCEASAWLRKPFKHTDLLDLVKSVLPDAQTRVA